MLVKDIRVGDALFTYIDVCYGYPIDFVLVR